MLATATSRLFRSAQFTPWPEVKLHPYRWEQHRRTLPSWALARLVETEALYVRGPPVPSEEEVVVPCLVQRPRPGGAVRRIPLRRGGPGDRSCHRRERSASSAGSSGDRVAPSPGTPPPPEASGDAGFGAEDVTGPPIRRRRPGSGRGSVGRWRGLPRPSSGTGLRRGRGRVPASYADPARRSGVAATAGAAPRKV
jgi:hypothetical protein